MTEINTFTELREIIEKIGISVAEQTSQFLAALDAGIGIEDENELLATGKGLFDIAPNGDLHQLAIFINQSNARENPAHWSAGNWHKFHLYLCRTIKDYPPSRGYRYKKTNNRQGRFQYIITYNNIEYKKAERVRGIRLNLCKNCHAKLPAKWRHYGVDNFPIHEFYQAGAGIDFGIKFEYDCDQIPVLYPSEWKKVAQNYKEMKQWRCESCHLKLKNDKQYLHAHHSDGNPGNNAIANLKALCIACHAKQELHQHIEQLHDYKAFIKRYGER